VTARIYCRLDRFTGFAATSEFAAHDEIFRARHTTAIKRA
jgi:hypothetical protein